MPDRVVARCGCRIDLAGGTLDIWPLGQLHRGARTVNLAIDVPVSVELRRRDAGYVIHLGGAEHAAETLDELVDNPDTALLALTASALELGPAEMRLESASPRGGGLGGSSAIGAALIAAAECLEGRPESSALERAELSCNLEARLMGFPTGLQDQLPPLLGGALEIRYRPTGTGIRRLAVDLERLAESLTIVYSGRSHISGRTNWEVVRRRIDGDPATVELFEGVCDVARAMPSALEAGDFERVGHLVAEEWACRRRLADEVETPEIEAILEAAKEAGAWGGKAGGAGGGGCVVVLHPPEVGEAVDHAVRAVGGSILPAPPRGGGVEVDVVD